MSASFPPLSFSGKLRPSQQEVVKIAEKKLSEGMRRLHIVAPPGSGKTVTGLYLWAMCIKKPALVLSPNSAIQVQWAARTDLFQLPDGRNTRELVSTDPTAPGLLSSLTYQSVTLPSRGTVDLNAQALDHWKQRLIEKKQAQDPDEAAVWLEDLQRHNPDYFEQRLSAYRKVVRDQAAMSGEALQNLHSSTMATLERLRQQEIGLIILDECHHLMGHWGRVLAEAADLLNKPVILGLTATPPDKDGKPEEDIKRYDEFFGPIDYEVPVPAVVKDGFLAPYQDLAYFVRPEADELKYIASADQDLFALVKELCELSPLPATSEAPGEAENTVVETIRQTPVNGESDNDSENESTNESDEDLAEEDISEKDSSEQDSLEQEPIAAESSLKKIDPSLTQRESLPVWLTRVLSERRLPTGIVKDWTAFERRDPDFAQAARCFLLANNLPLPKDVPLPNDDVLPQEMPAVEYLVPVIDRYVRHRLRVSPLSVDRELAQSAIRRMRMFGVQITETSSQPCASPVGRVMAYSKSKCSALVPILESESKMLGEKLRAVVVADYEKTSAVTAEVEHLLDSEAGGAIAAFKTIVRNSITDTLNPILVTGSTVLIDDDLHESFNAAAQAWLQKKELDVQLTMDLHDGFHQLSGQGGDWSPRVYVEMITELFQQGLTRCLVGTRGLLGEGWDANKINVLIDLTTVTTSMTVNQLRGRSIRLDPQEKLKLANNWDVVCLAPEFTKGFDDYKRFRAKHQTLYGVTDDGAIEKGVGHVHPAFTEMRPELLEDNIHSLNEDMLRRVARRDDVRKLWKVGEPYQAKPIRAVEARPLGKRDGGGFPPFKRSRKAWNSSALALAIGEAVLRSLVDAELIADPGDLQVSDREGGYVRVFLEDSSPDDSRLFTESLHEVLGPLHQPRYVIPRYVDRVEDTWLSSMLPGFVGHYFQKRRPQQVMLHAVPSALARNKELVEIFQAYWNRLVSPGEAVYALREAGEAEINHARKYKLLPGAPVHEKEVFL